MLPFDKEKVISTIMTRRKDANSKTLSPAAPIKPEHTMNEGGEVDGMHAAAGDMIAAMHSKSAEHMKQAMQNFLDCHNAAKDAPSSGDEPK